MQPLELHYSRSKPIRLAIYSLLGAAAVLWVATGGVGGPDDGSGRRDWILRLLGADGLRSFGAVAAAVMAVLLILYLRRAFGDPVAARGDAAGVTINMLLRIGLRRPMGQAILEVVPVEGRGKTRGLTANSLAENEDEIEAWIGAILAAQSGSRPS